MLMMEDGAPFVQGVHSTLMYETSRRGKDQYAGKYLVAVGDRQEDGSCMFVKTSDPHWDWVEVDVLASYVEMGKFYRRKRNRLENYDPEGEGKEDGAATPTGARASGAASH